MKVLVIRHAIAEDRKAFARTGHSDELRPLTSAGRKKTKAAARGLRRVVPKIDLLATSPFVRAVETARIVRGAYRNVKSVHTRHLKPDGRVQDVLKWLRKRKNTSVVAVVGHEPQLGLLVGWLITGLQKSVIELKKGAGCLLELDETMRPGRARLLWALSPGQLRKLGKAKVGKD